MKRSHTPSKKSGKPQSITKQKAHATQEFFDKTKAGTKSGYQFNAAPINKDIAVKAMKEKIQEGKDTNSQHIRKRGAFVANLYKDDNELDEMKVLGGDAFDSDLEKNSDDDSELDEHAKKKREQKAARKTEGKLAAKASGIGAAAAGDNSGGMATSSVKINKLTMTKGSVALFAVSEIHEGKYAIVNHTRNLKGFLPLDNEQACSLKVGQLILASVTGTGTGKHNTETSGNLNRKL